MTQISFQRWSNKYSNTSKRAVGYIGELNELTLTPNPDEVDQLFTVPLADLLDKNKWVIRDFSTPVFTGNYTCSVNAVFLFFLLCFIFR